MAVKFTVQYNPDTRELFINGKSKGVYHEKQATEEVSDTFLSEVRKSEINTIFKNVCKPENN